MPTRSPTARRCRSSSTWCEHEGLCLGGSSGINIAGAIRLARDLGPGPHHRHHPVRLRHALPVEAVQPRVPARQRACRSRTGWSASERLSMPFESRLTMTHMTRAALPRRRLSASLRRHGARRSPNAAGSSSTRRFSTPPPAASRATAAISSAPTARIASGATIDAARTRTRSCTSRPKAQPLPHIGEKLAAAISTGRAATS